MTQPLILLSTEGTYPFHGGGVSTWCDVLTRNLPDIDFTLLSVMMHPYLTSKYKIAPNIRYLIKVPLWGIEDPGEFAWYYPTSAAMHSRWELSEKVIEREFLEPFTLLLDAIFSSEAAYLDLEKIGQSIVLMHSFFLNYDYHKTMQSKTVWKVFKNRIEKSWSKQLPTIAEISEALHLLYRFLIVIHFPVPETDLVHSAAAGFCGLPCIIAKLQKGTPYLLTEHGVYMREQYLNMRKHVKSFFVRWFLYQFVGIVVRLNYYFADQVSPVCAYNRRWEQWWGVSREKIKVIYNGVDPDKFQPPLNRPSISKPVVTNVGLIFPLKGTLDLIEAAATVSKDFPEVEFRLYGSASDKEYFDKCKERVVEQKLEKTVIFAGSTNEPWKVYGEANIVAFASVSEGFPYVVIEAMLTGAAIVATDVGGVREALADTGLLVRPHRPNDLATAITSLLKDPERIDFLGARARKRALELFTQEKFLDEYRESYKKLLYLYEVEGGLERSQSNF